uniref:Uncharacterized protein orf154 n=1 Tax=Bradyrhizobium japonicum TaxID=375 RepID=Q9JMW2_BRAJP|nr:unknown [Bradyrhizobium japonicum]
MTSNRSTPWLRVMAGRRVQRRAPTPGPKRSRWRLSAVREQHLCFAAGVARDLLRRALRDRVQARSAEVGRGDRSAFRTRSRVTRRGADAEGPVRRGAEGYESELVRRVRGRSDRMIRDKANAQGGNRAQGLGRAACGQARRGGEDHRLDPHSRH